jgi:hypothetical protein
LNEFRELTAYVGNTEVFKEKRVRVRGKANMTLLPDFFLVEVYNMEDEDRALLETKKELKIIAKDKAVLACGEVEDIYDKQEDMNIISVISLSDGQSFWETRIDRTVGAGACFSQTIRQIIQNVQMGSYLADDPRFPRAQTFCGRLADIISGIAKGVDARAFISDNVLHVVQKGRSEIIVKITEEDLLEEPRTASGVVILRTDVKAWPVGMLHEFREKQHRLVSQEVNADNFSGPWQTELMLADESMLDKGGMGGG